jgi:hypothetical protein
MQSPSSPGLKKPATTNSAFSAMSFKRQRRGSLSCDSALVVVSRIDSQWLFTRANNFWTGALTLFFVADIATTLIKSSLLLEMQS